jgi:hypothetical protein
MQYTREFLYKLTSKFEDETTVGVSEAAMAATAKEQHRIIAPLVEYKLKL